VGSSALVVSGNLKRFLTNVDKMFPGAPPVRIVGAVSDKTTVATKVLDLLKATKERVLTAKEIAKMIGKPWRKISSDLITDFFKKQLAAFGWDYILVTGKVRRGEQGTRFERLAPMVHQGVLSAYM
jgi:hypothetical protein